MNDIKEHLKNIEYSLKYKLRSKARSAIGLAVRQQCSDMNFFKIVLAFKDPVIPDEEVDAYARAKSYAIHRMMEEFNSVLDRFFPVTQEEDKDAGWPNPDEK